MINELMLLKKILQSGIKYEVLAKKTYWYRGAGPAKRRSIRFALTFLLTFCVKTKSKIKGLATLCCRIHYLLSIFFGIKTSCPYFCRGEMAERSNAAVLKTVEAQVSGGSNPSLSAKIINLLPKKQVFLFKQA
jgi:hypothetical protein